MKWMPISTAPTHKRILLYYDKELFTGINIVIGYWEFEMYSKNPKPYWSNDLEHLSGKIATRSNQPNFWMPLPGRIQ